MSTQTSTLTDNTTSSKAPGSQSLHKVVIPSLVTAVFGFLIWNAQTQIQQTLNNGNQILQAQMVLREEYYKRRLTIYEDTCKQVATVRAALEQAGATPERETEALNGLAELSNRNRSNVLYWSDDLERRLDRLWMLGIDKIRKNHLEDNAVDDQIRAEVSGLYQQMKEDLQVKEMSRILEPKE